MRGLGVVIAFAAAAAVGATAAPARLAPDGLARACPPGTRHAVIAGTHECLRAGAKCRRRYDARYHRYGFHCHGSRLTRRSAAPPAPPPAPNADLALTVIDSPDPVAVGGELTFALTVTNAGPATPARVVAGTEQLASQISSGSVRVVRLDAACTETFGVVNCVFTNVAPGATVTASIVVRPMSSMTLSASWHVAPSDTLRTQDTNTANNHVAVTTTVGP